jgi:hypothetical protein
VGLSRHLTGNKVVSVCERRTSFSPIGFSVAGFMGCLGAFAGVGLDQLGLDHPNLNDESGQGVRMTMGDREEAAVKRGDS